MAITRKMLIDQKSKLRKIIENVPQKILDGNDISANSIKPKEKSELLDYLTQRFGTLAKYTLYLLLFLIGSYVTLNAKYKNILQDPTNLYSIAVTTPLTNMAGITNEITIQFFKYYLSTFAIKQHFFPTVQDFNEWRNVVLKFHAQLAGKKVDTKTHLVSNTHLVVQALKGYYLDSTYGEYGQLKSDWVTYLIEIFLDNFTYGGSMFKTGPFTNAEIKASAKQVENFDYKNVDYLFKFN